MSEPDQTSGRSEPAVLESQTQLPQAGRSTRWRRAFRAAWVILLLGTFTAIGFAFLRGNRSDVDRLQGDWHYSAAGRSNLGVIRIEGDTWSYHSGGQFGRSYRLTLRPEANPKEIDLAQLGEDGQPVTFTHGVGKGQEVKLLGIYEIHGDEVKLALGITERPKDFDDDEAQLLTLTK